MKALAVNLGERNLSAHVGYSADALVSGPLSAGFAVAVKAGDLEAYTAVMAARAAIDDVLDAMTPGSRRRDPDRFFEDTLEWPARRPTQFSNFRAAGPGDPTARLAWLRKQGHLATFTEQAEAADAFRASLTRAEVPAHPIPGDLAFVNDAANERAWQETGRGR